MARNHEKNLCGLNRYVLAKRNEGKAGKKAARPHIHSLTSAEEAKKWIPSIKKEIDYCLRQIECATKRNYSDEMVKEFEERVERLEKEHWRFVHKVRELDPTTVGIPWQGREYTVKRLQQQNGRPRHVCSLETAGALTSALLNKQKPSKEKREDLKGDEELGVDETTLRTDVVYHTATTMGVTNGNQGCPSSVTRSNQGSVLSVTRSNQGSVLSVTRSNQGSVLSVTSSNHKPLPCVVPSTNQGLVSSTASTSSYSNQLQLQASVLCTSDKPAHLLGLEYSSSSEEEEEGEGEEEEEGET